MSKIAEAWKLLEIALSWQENENEKLNVFLSELTKSGYLLDYGDLVADRITNAFLSATHHHHDSRGRRRIRPQGDDDERSQSNGSAHHGD